MNNFWIIGALLISTSVMAQKKNETSAAVEYKNKFVPALRSQDFETAQKSILNAKEFIDLAAVHPDTKGSSKTQWLRGEIYMGMVTLAQMAKPGSMDEATMASNLKISRDAFEAGYDLDNKYDSDITESIERARYFFDQAANKMYQAEKYTEAGKLYEWQGQFSSAIDVLDTNAVFYSGLCFEKAGDYASAADNYLLAAKGGFKGASSYYLAAGATRKAGNIEKAKEIINEGRAKYPSDRDLLLELVNINIDANDPAGAEAALNAAISTDPNNKQLHYTIGTIYIELKQNDKAEKALMKALEIDPNYVDAQYQLGAHLVSWAGDLKTEAAQLKFGDARYDVMLSQSQDIYKRAVNPLEKYIANNPKDKDVLNILFQLNRNLGNTEKALEYKKRMDAL
ncbi:MAG: tetratricopeptide repeat protein [Bacteroidetes bacterium]|nr:tetratricopeptide repeat protein [Bacteroidota bacterium]